MIDHIPPSPPRNPKGKLLKFDKIDSFLNETQLSENGEIVSNRQSKKKFRCCADYECHVDLFHDWITYKYRDDPKMRHVTKDKWREILHTEYFNHKNFREWRKWKNKGNATWPHNILDRGYIHPCIYDSLERFIDEQYSLQAREWHRRRTYAVESDTDKFQTYKKMDSEDVEKEFREMIEARNDAISEENSIMPDTANPCPTYARHKITKPYH